MMNHGYSGSRNHPTHEDRANWNQSDDQQRSDRDRDRDDDRRASERNRPAYSDQDTGSFSRDRETMTERYGQGQSGYGAGRHGEDRSGGYQNRNQAYPSGGYDDRQPDRSDRSGMGLDDRFSGRGGGDWPERSNYYGSDRGREQDYRGSRRGTGSGMGSGMGRPSDTGRYESGRSGASGYGSDYGDYGESRHGGYGYRRAMAGDRGMSNDRGMDYDRGMGMDYDRGMGMDYDRGMGGHRGKGPKDWQRSDERIRESVNEALADHDHIDATHIQVAVKDGEVTLSGIVEDRRMKRLAEDCVEQVSGVKEVQNNIRVQGNEGRVTSASGTSRTSTSGDKSNISSDKKTHS